LPEDDMGPFNWTLGDNFWFWADVALPTSGADYQDWMNSDGIMGSMGSGDNEVEMFLLVPTGIVGETHSFIWLMGNATADKYSSDASITIDFGEVFMELVGPSMSYKLVFDDLGVCIDFTMTMDGKTLRLQGTDDPTTDPTDDESDPSLGFTPLTFVVPMVFVACLTYIRRRK
ncbi:MAG: hypothetical protein ACTSYA_07785, partial [Candidatus Kariarchaeaceae archaeon]